MLIGKRFKIGRATLALHGMEGKIGVVSVPAGATIQVLSNPSDSPNPMVEVQWEDRQVTMFLIDVTRRGTEIANREDT